jgi:hypothetical protein
MLTEAVILALVSLANKSLDLVMLMIQDQPKAERVAAWQRWFDFWAPVWKAVGLDTSKPPIV